MDYFEKINFGTANPYFLFSLEFPNVLFNMGSVRFDIYRLTIVEYILVLVLQNSPILWMSNVFFKYYSMDLSKPNYYSAG